MRWLTASSGKKNKGNNRKQPNRLREFLGRRSTRFCGIGLLVLGVAGGLTFYARSSHFQQIEATARSQYAALTDHFAQRWGLVVREILVTGRYHTDRDDLLAALAAYEDMPIFDFDPRAAQQRLTELGWVKAATVTRSLPNSISITLEERNPIAIWQHRDAEGKPHFSLIDGEGVVIGDRDLEQFQHLTIVTGDDAPEHSAELITMLQHEAALAPHVVAAVRVAGRRWNLHLDNGIDIRLPEQDMGAAWAQLAKIQQDHGILQRDISAIDMRQPDRLIVRLTKSGVESLWGHHDET